MKKLSKLLNKKSVSIGDFPDFITYLIGQPGATYGEKQRIDLTVSCNDCAYIPKTKKAGELVKKNGTTYQIMHNGLLVEHGGYFGNWMSDIIKQLKGHHEPQEEKVFFEILKRIDDKGTMIELGSFWAYYSLWFNKSIKNSLNICCEPDPINIELGKRNAHINNIQNIHFVQALAGDQHNSYQVFKPEFEGRPDIKLPIKTVDGLVDEFGLKQIDVLHMDIQGQELYAINGARKSIESKKIRFLVVSTHHHYISGDPLTHEKCLQKIVEMGGHVVCEHGVQESFSGDGLIVASFLKKDSDFKVDVSVNRASNTIFRTYNSDLQLLAEKYEELRDRIN